MHTVYKRLGQLEMHDQIEVTKHIVSEHEAIDPKKVGIYGWSYGGYSTSHVLGYGN
jgi:dipeptidyl aminopeptidase/acylaminoacyl peptidase